MMNVFGFSDEAKRLSDAANTALVNGAGLQWLAFALRDGSVEGMPDRPQTYLRRQDAVRNQGAYAGDFGYIKIPLDGVTARGAEVMVKLQRQLKEAGMQLIDPEVADRDFPTDNRREAMPSLDRRRLLVRSRHGLFLP